MTDKSATEEKSRTAIAGGDQPMRLRHLAMVTLIRNS